jgi:hypothetical protein
MGIFTSLFGKPADRVGGAVRRNSELVDAHMKKTHSVTTDYGDFRFEYLYTSSELVSQDGTYGSVIYIRVESSKHECVSSLPRDFRALQDSISEHQNDCGHLPNTLSKEMTRWLYFNMGTIFRITRPENETA